MLTEQDKAFLKAKTSGGMTYDQAWAKLSEIKQKKGLTGGSFMTRAASVAENAPTASPEIVEKAGGVKEGFSEMSQNIGEQSKIDEMKPSLGESALNVLGGPVLGAVPEIASDAYQSAKTLGKGLLKQAETAAPVASALTGNIQPLMNEFKQPSEDKGTGLKETVQGTLGLVGAPLTGILKDTFGEEKANAIMETMNKPFEWGADKILTSIAEAKGIDTTTPEFQESKDQMATAFNLGFALLLDAGYGKVKGKPKTTKTVITESLEKAIRPSVKGKNTFAQMEKYGDKSVQAVESVVKNKDNLKLTTPEGEVVSGVLPENLKQFSEAIGQTKNEVFKKYNNLQEQVGAFAADVDLTKPVGDATKGEPITSLMDDLDTFTESKSLNISSPETISYVDKLKSRLPDKLDPQTAQDLIKQYNSKLEAFYKSPDPAQVGTVIVDSLVANKLRKYLDNLIEELTGEEYQVLKDEYGALKSIEADVTKRAIVDARKNAKGFFDIADIFTGAQAIDAILSFSGTGLLKAGAMQAIKAWIKRLNDPNKIVKSMFEKVEEAKPTTSTNLVPTAVVTQGEPNE